MRFKKFNGDVIEDLAVYLKSYFAQGVGGEYEIYVGCDSLPPKKKQTTYVTVVCIRNIGRGVHILYRKDRDTNVKPIRSKKETAKDMDASIKQRLQKEVQLSIEVADYLRSKGILTYRDKGNNVKSLHIDIHLDINPDATQKSNKVFDYAIGYVQAMGFAFTTKPNAWAATYAADMVCRGRFDHVPAEKK